MTRKKSDLSTPEYAILGLLCQEARHGYQIAQELRPDSGLGLVCPLRLSNVYFLLGNLERRGLIEVDHHSHDVYPPKTVFKATAAGGRTFQAWIWQPLTRLRQVRLDFLLKVYFLGEGDREGVLRLLDQQIDFCQSYLSQWTALTESAELASFDRLAMQAKVAAAQGTRDWLIAYRQRLAQSPSGGGERP